MPANSEGQFEMIKSRLQMSANTTDCSTQQCKKELKSRTLNLLIKLNFKKALFSTRPSDRAQILHACADRDEIGSQLKKILTDPTPL